MATQRFSFGLDDHTSSYPDEQERLNRNFETQNYRDAPARDAMSPPPHYTSPNQPASSIPTSPAPAAFHYPTPQQYYPSRNVREDRRYLDDTPPPPAPPPHRTSPTRLSQNGAINRKPLVASDSYEDRSGQPLMQTTQDPYVPEGGAAATNMTTQFAGLQQPSDLASRSRGTSPHYFPPRPTSRIPDQNSYSSNIPLTATAGTPGSMTPTTQDIRSSRYSSHSLPLSQYSSPSQHHMGGMYHDSPYHSSSHEFDATVSSASINPHNIADDGDDGFMPQPKRKSALGLGRSKAPSPNAGVATGVGAAAGAGIGGFYGHNSGKQAASSTYGPMNDEAEKSAWLAKQGKGGRRMRCMVGAAIGLFIVLAVVGGILGGVFGSRKSANSGSKSYDNAADDYSANGDLNINSAEIKALMNNPDLHKVFPGMDYTPWGVQYPLCNRYPPSQNNVTRDMAVISQLTNTVRLYGTDCNSTEMVLHAIDRLQLKNMKLWIGVWIDTNQTTNERQLAHMYHLLENVIQDHSIVKGVIIGNEALFRAGESKDEARLELATLLEGARTNITNLGWDLKIGTSDLGDNWNAALVAASDFVMSNIHPFFAGIEAEQGAAWTYSFWKEHNLPLTASYPDKEQIIAETGWPSGGGTDCGGADGSCAAGQSGAVASVDNMNTFMKDWVCQALENGTNYFWFEAFDEAWKVQYNEPEKKREWEDKWGLMDTGRNLKPGIKIPDCGGRTV